MAALMRWSPLLVWISMAETEAETGLEDTFASLDEGWRRPGQTKGWAVGSVVSLRPSLHMGSLV